MKDPKHIWIRAKICEILLASKIPEFDRSRASPLTSNTSIRALVNQLVKLGYDQKDVVSVLTDLYAELHVSSIEGKLYWENKKRGGIKPTQHQRSLVQATIISFLDKKEPSC